jgi:cellulose 1,4-beta-cellobiosidase
MEIAEEEHIFHQILEEQQSRTLPENSPAVASTVAGPAFNAMTGGGGVPVIGYLKPTVTNISFSVAPGYTGVAPYKVFFTNNSSPDALSFYTWNWDHGDGTTGSRKDTLHTYATGSYNVSLTGSSPQGITTQSFYANVISASIPTVVSALSWSVPAGYNYPVSVSFYNNSTYNGSGNLTYLWSFGSGSLTSSVVNPSPVVFNDTGIYTASLQVTESSYNIMSYSTQSIIFSNEAGNQPPSITPS